MKILYALHKFLPRYFSGTETYTYYLARELQRRGHEVQVFCADEVERGPDCEIQAVQDRYNGIPVHRINFNRKKTPDIVRFAYNNPIVAEHFHTFLALVQPDIVHITSFLNLSAAIIDPIKGASIPAVFTATDFWCFCPKSNFLKFDSSLCKAMEVNQCLACIISLSPFYNRILKTLKVSPTEVARVFSVLSRIPKLRDNAYVKGRKALEDRSPHLAGELKRLDLVITPTPFLREFFLHLGLPEDNVLTSAFGLNTEGIKPRYSSSPGEPIRFGYIGMLAELKGVDILIRSFSQVPSSPGVSLTIYGDNSHFPDYCRHLSKLAQDTPNILFAGTFPPDKLGEILATIDILVVPSIWYENTPLIIHSALAAGVPVIGSDVPGIAALVKDGINGLLFPRGEEESLKRCLGRFLAEPDLLQKLQKNVRTVKHISEQGAELESLYQTLIEDEKIC